MMRKEADPVPPLPVLPNGWRRLDRCGAGVTRLKMTKAAPQASANRSRLVRFLAELSTLKVDSAQQNLAEQLGRLIDLSDSITLARALGRRPPSAGERCVDSAARVHQDLLETRERMMRAIARSFAPETGPTRIKVPSSRANAPADKLQTFEPYQRFYVMHQAEMDTGIESLRLRVREGISGFAPELAQLADLDKTLSDSLALHTRKLFSVIPKLLEQRFQQLLAEHQQFIEEQGLADEQNNQPAHWLVPGGWLERFYQDMRELLLAEFDVRLQPVLGLLEALNERVDTTL